MIEHRFDQRSPEWHIWRKSGIGASETAAIMGVSPWMCSQDLWEYKKGIRPGVKMNPAIQRGIDHEPFALSHFEMMTGIIMEPLCATHDTYDYILASLDGVTPDRKMHVEIKCPGLKSHLLALRGVVPIHYMWQIQQQLLVLGNPKGIFFSYLKDYPDQDKVGVMVEVDADPVMQAEIIAQGRIFQDHILSNTPLYTPEWATAAREWLVAQAEVEDAVALLEDRREKLILIANGVSTKGAGVSLSINEFKPTVDWEAFYKAESINDPALDRFIKKTFDNKAYMTEVKPDEKVLAPYLNPPKANTIGIRRVNNAIDNKIMADKTVADAVLVNPVIAPSIEREALYEF